MCCHLLGVRREIFYQCESYSNIPLCVEPCYEIYHSRRDIKSNLYDDEDISGSSDTSTFESESDEEFQE